MHPYRHVRWILLVLLLAIAPAVTTARAMPQANGDQTVYVTKTGKKYHTADCRYLRKSKTPLKLKDAVKAGYTPCSVCNPPTLKEK
jgi:hypothetical protein